MVPWALGTLWVANSVLQPPTERPSLLVVSVAAIAMLPLALWIVGQTGGPRGPFRFLYRSPQPALRIGPDGLEVEGLATNGRRTYAWGEIGSLDGASPFRSSRWLRAPDGTGLIDIPDNFAVVKFAGSNRRTRLAEVVVSMKPDTFVLAPKFGLNILAGFRRRSERSWPSLDRE